VGSSPLFLVVYGKQDVAQNQVVQQAWEELEPHLREQGYELVEVELGQQGNRKILRVYMDREGGVTLDDCAAVSQLLSPILDARDFVGGAYVLEVSSPGIDRPLRKAKDFERYIGERIRLKAHTPVNGRRQFKGMLTGFRDGLLAMDCDGTTYKIHIQNVLKANLDR
jgi:ribosome maturation factor RimP